MIDVAVDGGRVRHEIVAAIAASTPNATLGTVLVSDDEPARRAMAAKHRHAARAGIGVVAVDLPVAVSQEDLAAAVTRLVDDPTVDGIFLQLPLPDHLDPAAAVALIPPERDIDGLTPMSSFPSAGARAVVKLLERDGVDLDGVHVVLVGDSPYVTAPLTRLLAGRAVVTTVADPADAPAGSVVVDLTAPGGVGPVTIACLLEHTVQAAQRRRRPVGH